MNCSSKIYFRSKLDINKKVIQVSIANRRSSYVRWREGQVGGGRGGSKKSFSLECGGRSKKAKSNFWPFSLMATEGGWGSKMFFSQNVVKSPKMQKKIVIFTYGCWGGGEAGYFPGCLADVTFQILLLATGEQADII